MITLSHTLTGNKACRLKAPDLFVFSVANRSFQV